MWTLAKICAAGAIWLVAAENVAALDLPEPFVAIEVQSQPAHLGEAWGPGVKQMRTQVRARIVANCPYHIEASFRGLRHRQGKAVISPNHMSVVINGREVPAGTARVPVATSQEPTPRGGVDVPIDLQVAVRGLEFYPPGRYVGILVLTVMAGT